jgi:hypothetical protein
VNDLAGRLRALAAADAVALAGLGMVLVGVAATVEALIEAARSTPNASLLSWYDRLSLGLWEFRIEHTVWFTAGLLALWWALSHGATLSGWSAYAGRLAGGLAVGYALVGAAMVIASTVVALRGGVGSGDAHVAFSTRERTLVWLLQVATGLGAGLVWALIAARVPEDATPSLAEIDEEPVAPVPAELPEPATPPVTAAAAQVARFEPPAPAPESPAPAQPAPSAIPVAEAAPAAVTPMQQAHEIFRQRLAYSPRRDEARRLLDQVTQAERAGRTDEARDLVERLSRL